MEQCPLMCKCHALKLNKAMKQQTIIFADKKHLAKYEVDSDEVFLQLV